MFTVKWVVTGREKEPVEVEEFVVNGREVLLEACQDRLPAMRLRSPRTSRSAPEMADAARKPLGSHAARLSLGVGFASRCRYIGIWR
jgi:hypothetical protein